MKDYFFALLDLLFLNVKNKKGVILLGIFLGFVFIFGVSTISDRNTKIFFLIAGTLSFLYSAISFYKEKK